MYMLAAIGPTLYVAAVKNGRIQSLTLNTMIIPLILVGSSSLLLYLLHLFPLLCGVDVSCETPTSRAVLRVHP